jgi:hypothetical protein
MIKLHKWTSNGFLFHNLQHFLDIRNNFFR